MDTQDLINNIKSTYIAENIFDYINDKNFNIKLFFYSKKYQKKFDIKLIELKEKYLSKIGFYINDYLDYSYEDSDLSKKYDDFLEKKNINKEKLENMIYDIYEYKTIKSIDEEDLGQLKNSFIEEKINIDSPLFNLISKTKYFEKIYNLCFSKNYK